jgi:hypothetical protein
MSLPNLAELIHALDPSMCTPVTVPSSRAPAPQSASVRASYLDSTAARVNNLELVADAVPLEPSPALSRDPLPLGFSKYDRASALAFTSAVFPPTTAEEVVEHARQLAEALAGPDGSSCRVRTLARRVAVCRAQAEQLDVLLAAAVKRADFVAARALNGLLTGATKRMTVLLEHLAREAKPRSVVIAANTANGLVR